MVVGVDVPVVITFGLSESVTGTGLFTAIDADADAPPPGAGLTAATLIVPGDARSAVVRIAVSCVPLTKVVCRAIPSICTVVAATKPVPLMATEADAEPAGNEDGEIWVIAAMGLLICRLTELVEMLVPPLLATIDALPAVASWLVGMTAVTCVLVT
jgi:hypothetical protein